MRKIKSTALLGAFVAVASVGVISHEAHGAIILTPNGIQPAIISKEMLPNPSATFQAFIVPSVGLSDGSITLTISGASFVNGDSYTIAGANCSATAAVSGQNSLTFSNCTVSGNTQYAFMSYPVNSNSSFTASVSASSSSIALSYIAGADTAPPTTIATVQQQLSFAPISAGTAYISPSSLSTFLSNSYANGGSSASNFVVLLNSAYNNNTWSNTINQGISMTFVFTGIPGSVSGVTASDNGGNNLTLYNSIVNGSATVSGALAISGAPFKSASSDTITFTFSNSSNVSISTGTISLSSIVGSAGQSYSSVTYLSTPENFLTFAIGGTQLYVPDALAPDGNNGITSGYITISMPQGASIASISVLNTGVSCSVSSLSLAPTGTTNVTYIDLSQLPSLCGPDITPKAWGSGVPLVIYITNATPTQITADAYATFGGMLKRIPVNVTSLGSSTANFSY